MKLGKRMLAWLLSLALLLSVTPFSVFALTEEEAAEAITLFCGEEWVLDAAENGGVQTFVFVPEESGRYVFYSYDNDYDVRAYIYDGERDCVGSDDDDGGNLNFRITSDLTAGETYYYVAQPYSGQSSGTYCVKLELEVLPEITLEEPRVGTLAYGENGECVFYKFIPEEDGTYAACESGDWYKSITITDRDGYGTSSSGYNVNCQYEMTAGKTYYLRLYNGSGEDCEYSLSVKKLSPAESMTIEGGYDTVQIGTRFTLNTTFAPEDAIEESVTWESSDEEKATVSTWGSVTFHAAGTVTITATSENGLVATREFTVSPAVELVYGDTVSAETDENGNVTFVLRATEAGTVRVEGRGDVSSETRLLDADGWQMNAFGGTGLDTEVAFENAGECVYFQVRTYNEGVGSWVFTVTPLVPAKSVTIVGGDIEGYVDESRDLRVEFAPENAITEAVTWESSDESVAEVDDWGRVYLYTPGTATVTATSENGLTDSITVTVKAPDLLESGVEVSGTLTYGQADMYQFTLQEDAWCVFSSIFTDDADEGIQQYLRVEDEDGNWYVSLDGSSIYRFALLKGGKTYTVRVQHDDYGDQETIGNYRLLLTVNALSALETLSVDGTVTGMLEEEDVHFYRFTPEVDGTYRFTSEYADEYDYYTYIELYDTVGDELGNVWGNGAMSRELTAGETYYLIVRCRNENGAEYSVTTMWLPPAESLTIEGGDFEGFVGAEYALQAVFAPENAVQEYVTWTSSDESVAMFDHGSNWLILCGAGTATLTATSRNGLTDSVTVTVKAPTPLEAGVEASGTVVYQETDAYQFTLEEDAWCSIVSTAVGEEFEQYLRVNDENGYGYVSWSGWAAYPCVLLEGGKTYNVQMRHDDYSQSELVGNYTMMLKVMPLSELPAIGEGETETGTLPFGVSDVFAFTPEEDGVYKVEMESADYSWDTTVYDAAGRSFNNVWGNGSMQVTLTAGETYYLSVCSTSRNGASYDLNLTRLMPAESLIIYADEIEGFVGEWLYFEADFAPEECIRESVEWSSSDESVATVDMWGEVHLLGVGTATITATSENGLTASEVVTVSTAVTLTLDNTMNGTLAYGEKAAYAFTLPSDGGYRITYGGDYKHVIVRDSWGDSIHNSWTTSGTCLLNAAAGETYYVYFEGIQEDSVAAYDVTVAALVPATGMTIVGGDRTGYMNTSVYFEAAFTPDNAMSESVMWSSSDDEIVSVSEWGEAYLLAIGTATITATSESGFTDSITVTVKDYDPIALDTEYAFNNENGNIPTVFSFTPTEDGTYCFYSYGNETDPYANLYDADWNWLESDYNNFRLQWRMTAGETYYLRVESYTSRVGNYYVQAIKLQPAETMTIPNYDTTVAEGDIAYLHVEFGPEGCATEDVTWHSSDESVATVTEWGSVYFVGDGTVTITATSESGLTASITFTVSNTELYEWQGDVSGTLAPQSACIYQWTVPEDGIYRITFGGGYKNNAVRYPEGGYLGNCWSENWSYSGYFEAGEVYNLYMSNERDEAVDYTVKITRPGAATALVIDQGDFAEGFEGDVIGLSVTFEPEDALVEAVTYTSANESIATVNGQGTVYLVGAGTTVITATSANGLQDEIVVRSKATLPLQPDVQTEGIMQAHSKTVYSFLAPETETYTFTIDSGYYKFCRIYDQNGDYINSSSGYYALQIAVQLEAGETYFLSVQTYEEYGDYTVCVSQTVAATEMTIDQGDAVQGLVSASLNLSVTFGPEDAKEEEVTWTSDDPSVVYVSWWGSISLIGEGTATLTATSESGLQDSITVTVTLPPALTLNVPLNGTIVGQTPPVYCFVPTEDGVYSFLFAKEPYGEIFLMDADLEYISGYGGNDNVTVQGELTAGERYYVNLYQYDANAEYNFTLTVTDTVPATSMSITDGDTYSAFPGGGHRFQVTFGPENAVREEVTWTSSDPEIAEVYEDGYAEFYRSGTVVITATSESGFTDSITVTLKTIAEAARPLTSNRAEVSTEEVVTVFAFTPAESGKYAFTSSLIDGHVDPMIALYDVNEEELARADDADGMQFRLEYTLTAGETYYLYLRYYECEADSYLLTIERAQELTAITIAEGDIEGDINDEYQLSVEFTPAGATPEGYVFTSANPLVATVSESGWLWLRGAGTTTVTVTSDSGLTDTITVTVSGAHEHAYDTACDTDCNLCGEVREVPHTYSSACDATCDLCGAVRVVAAAHTYDNACDAVCNLCGATRTVEHSYSGACDPLCNVCGAPQADVAAHTYDNACDVDCNVCGTVREIVHDYSGDCDTNCNVCDEERDALAEHTHDNACDTSCNVCGATRAAEHTYAGDCDTVCNICGDVRVAVGEHEYEDNADTVCDVCGAQRDAVHQYSGVCDTTCDLCGEERETSTAHTYDNACDTNCNVCGATRVTEHVYDAVCDAICNVCNFMRTDAEAHDYDNACDTDCNVCGTGRVTVHTYMAPCDGFCDVCGAEREPLDRHTRENDCQANCTLCGEELEVAHDYSGSCDPSCNRCGVVRDDVAAHAYDNVCDTVCNGCGVERAVDHVYTAACDAQCNVCGNTRTVQQEHRYSNACDANCNVCGATRTPAAHVYDNACDANCNVCGATRTPAAHVYDNACDASCNVCGAVRTPAAHVYANACDADCNVCGATRTPAAHVYDNACDANCNVCGATRTPAAHVYANACDKDCNVCGATRTPATHVYDNDRDADCNVCGAVREVESGLLGDVDGNGKIDSTDARMVLQYAVKKIDASALNVELADVDGSGKVDSTDARLILQYAVRKITNFPASA